jgi:hypothetical protein
MRARILQLTIALGLFLAPADTIFDAQTRTPAADAVALHVEGIVLDGLSGKPIEGAIIGVGNLGKSDAAGRFSVDLRPGAPTLSVSKEGYNPGKLVARSLPTNVPGYISFALPVDQPWKDLVIRMNPSATVTGKIFDAQGHPMQDATVQPFVYVYSPAGVRYRINLATNAPKTNDLGIFRYERLDAGDYYFEIRPSSPDLGGGMMLAPVFYPNAIDAEHSEPVHVDAGSTVQLKNVTPPTVRGGNLSVRLVNNTGEEARAGATFFVGRAGEMGFNLKTGIIPKEKLYEVQDLGSLPSGHYFVYGGFTTPSPGISETRTYFDITGSDALIDLPVNKYKPINVTGHAVLEDGSNDGRPVAGIKLMFHEIGANSATLNPFTPPTSIVSQADGTFALTGTRALNPAIPPYTYRIRPFDLPQGMYVKAIRGIDGDMYTPGSVRDLNLTVVVGNDAGTVEGVVKDSKGAKVPLGGVVLIPDEPSAALRIATATTASNGAFKLQAAPGGYHLYAWGELIGAPYLNTDYMSKISDKGTAVRIAANGHATMDVTVIENR